jgi:hypothetical protein
MLNHTGTKRRTRIATLSAMEHAKHPRMKVQLRFSLCDAPIESGKSRVKLLDAFVYPNETDIVSAGKRFCRLPRLLVIGAGGLECLEHVVVQHRHAPH